MRNASQIAELADVLAARRSGKGKVILFVGAGISTHGPSYLPLANALKKATVDLLLRGLERILPGADLRHRIAKYIRNRTQSTDPARRVPLEMIYDAIHEVAGEKVYAALDCLKAAVPNDNHRVLAHWLEGGYVDSIITTNFDCLLERSLTRRRCPERC